MRSVGLVSCSFFLLAFSTFAQNDRGTVTGTVADPAGAVVANAMIQMKHVQTGAVYEAASTNTGNYTIAQLPVGTYEMSVTVPGFKKYVRQNIGIEVAQTLRLDVTMEVGSATESVTVTEEVTLLKTESGELSHTVTSQKLDDLPILGTGAANASTWGVRNTYTLTELIPGTMFNSNTVIRVNGAVSNTQTIAIEGQDATDRFLPFSTVMTQPSADAIQDVAVQTSNFAAEFGQVGGGYFNMTVKSGTNQYHGTAYDYYANEALNAAQPYTNLKDTQRRNDFGGSVGGPLWIPKIYDGHNRTFFFLNLEYFRQRQIYDTTPQTVPTDLYRAGNFSQALTGRILNTDPLGRPIPENAIYDPNTQRTVNGVLVRDQFPGNIIPASRFDPVALKVQALIPLATSSALVNNIVPSFPSHTITNFPAYKGDQQLGSKMKLSVYWSESSNIRQYSPGTGNADGLPDTITQARGNFIGSHTERLNFDYSITPTLLLHVGGGYQHLDFEDKSPTLTYDSYAQLGLKGQTYVRNFPTFNGLCTLAGTVCTGQGGMVPMGPPVQSISGMVKPTFNSSLTYVRGNHTYKTGWELRFEGYPVISYTSAKGNYTFSPNQTGLPSTQGQNLNGGSTGFAYADFLLGMVDNGTIGNVTDARGGKSQTGVFVQDSWKITRKLTLDYGIRYDYSTYSKEEHGRAPDFSPTTPDPTVGGRLGAPIFEGFGPNYCNCNFAKNYPYAIGPRLGAAYQLNSKTVMRAGWGIVYTGTPNANLATSAVSSTPFTSPSPYAYAMLLQNGVPLTPAQYAWPNFSNGLYPVTPATIGASPMSLIDPNAGRPARQNQWSIGLQREIFRNLAVEASYVANRGAWWQGNSLLNYNALTPQILSAVGLNINNAADRTLLTSTVGSALAASRGFGLPYPGFPANQTVAQSLRPFPQFTTVSAIGAPLGKTWYDSGQLKVTKRYSYGLDFSYSFTYQKELQMGAENDSVTGPGINPVVDDVFNRSTNKYISGQSQPMVSVLSLNYKLPAKSKLVGNRFLGYVVSDWQLGTVLNYASGLPLLVPTSNNALNSVLFRPTFANRVPGQPLYTVDVNCHCFDPNTTFVLNKNAWVDPPAGTFSSSAAYYSDYRQPRRPGENLNLGRTFRLVERVTLEIRGEFSNVLNRAYFASPAATNAALTQTVNKFGQTTAGFGYINVQTPLAATFAAPGPRNGSVVARFRF